MDAMESFIMGALGAGFVNVLHGYKLAKTTLIPTRKIGASGGLFGLTGCLAVKWWDYDIVKALFTCTVIGLLFLVSRQGASKHTVEIKKIV